MNEPLHIISLGAGVQSSTMALMAACGEITPMPSCAIFADTQAEPAGVYKWLDWLEKQLPFPVYRVSHGNLEREALRVRTSKAGNKYTNSNITVYIRNPDVTMKEGIQSRQCTGDFKIDPIHVKIREVASVGIKAWRKGKKVGIIPVTQWIGISRDEIIRIKPSRKDYIKNIWPLVDLSMTRKDCVKWMKAKGFQEPPRSACVFCPYHNDAEWRRLKTDEPEEFAKAVKFESDYQAAMAQITRIKGVPFLHKSCLPLGEINFTRKETDTHPDFFANECEGICGV